jgi:protein-L-isoaspartate(D-aspartate) O-methyltransferase
MTELLRLQGTEAVLEIGTGSGYQAAILAKLAGTVWTIERHPELARRAQALLADLGYENVNVLVGDGTLGLPVHAPFDSIMVTAAAPGVPQVLRDQLQLSGRMVIPVSAGYAQDLLLIEKLPGLAADATSGAAPDGPHAGLHAAEAPCRFRETSILGCVFVPLIGEHGYPG